MTDKDLSLYDYAIVVDRSGSMGTKDCPGGISRWAQAKDWAKSIAQKAGQYDSDGIDVVFFDDSLVTYEGVTASKVDELFRKLGPSGSTDTAKAINYVLQGYFNRRNGVSSKKGLFGGMFSKPEKKDPFAKNNAKPLIIICITDGTPNSQSELRSVIIDATKKIDSDQEIGITFIQVGNDNGARKFLKELDDNLTGAKYDIVDCKDYEEMSNTSIEEVFLAAVND